ncbi:MAG: hypothetical protein ABI672_10620 [Vicinamibacteria bacterium]
MDTLTLPAHVEGDSVRLDAPLPPDVQSVEVRVVLKTQQQSDVSSLIRLIASFPPGTRSQEDIDAEIEEGRADGR